MAEPGSPATRTIAPLTQGRVEGRVDEVAAALLSELDLDRLLAQVTDIASRLIGAERATFVLHGAELAAGAFDPFGPTNSSLAYPLVTHAGEPLGTLVFGHRRAGALTDRHAALLDGFGATAALAIENAARFQALERDREAAHRMAERLGQMHAVSARLAGAGTVEEVAAVIVTGAASALGCARASLFVLADGGANLRLLDSFGYEGTLHTSWARIDTRLALPTNDALNERRLIVLGGDDDWHRQYPDHADNPNRSVALAVIPLALGPHAFGVATFGWDEPRIFGEDEARFLEAVADQCAQALERARLYEVEREAARTLQESLLPPSAPEIPGLEVAAVFRPGDRSVAVGGDFYDVFPAGAHRWGIAMGDVCGRGARAASRTALVRYTLRAVAGDFDDPVAVLRRLNDAMLAEPEADDRFCATVFGFVELDRGGAVVTLACAGHPRPVVVRQSGWLDIRGQPGTLVGILEDLDVSADRVRLHPGDSLVFYTDGISEARNRDGDQFADEDLTETLLGAYDAAPSELTATVRERALAFAGGTLGDDFAVLAIRVPPDAGDEGDASRTGTTGGSAGRLEPGPEAGGRPLPPRVARTSLASEPGSARAARRFLAEVLMSWRMPELLEGDAALLLSELASNAILHARSPLTVIVRYDGRSLRVEVGDGSRAHPELQPPGPADATGGRGLLLVDRIAARWGIMPTEKGKRVWFELPAPPTPGPART